MDKKCMVLEQGCRFHLGDCPDAWQAWFDDSAWEEVTLPHDWSVTRPFSREYSSGTGYLAGGVGWYRLRFEPDPAWKGKRISVVFDGVYKNSRVWCNSYYLGERPNGYISYALDITEFVSFEHTNIVSVYVDHRDVADSRWFTGSGITRKVSLVVEEPVKPVYNGIFFHASNVSMESADFAVENELQNLSGEAVEVTVVNTLIRECSRREVTVTAAETLQPGEIKTLVSSGQVLHPALWSCENPALYRLETRIQWRQADGQELEYLADSCSVGIRSIAFDADQGFFLNGVSMKIKGVCVHHDGGCLGAAMRSEVWERRLEKLKAMGCNAIRMSHNPHMPELYELCDRMGFLVMDEAFDEWEGPKNKWSTGHNVYPPKHYGYYVDFPQWHERDLTDLIRRDRNHPSVVMWSIGNEIDYPNDPYCHPSFQMMTGNNDANKPAEERQYNPLRPDAGRLAPLAANLAAIVRSTDTTRPVTLAAAFPELSAGLGFLDALDVAGYNYKEHLYAQSHERFPGKPFIGSENGHSLEAWRAVTEHPYISGQFLWTGIDYLGEAAGWPVHGSGAGLLTTAGFEKPEYYRRQSFWAEEPVIHLATAYAACDRGEFTPIFDSWNYPEGEEIFVKCYTNLAQAEIFLNGQSLGVFEKGEKDCISLTVPFAPGSLQAVGLQDGKPAAEHELRTTGTACRVGLRCWAPRRYEEQDGSSKAGCPAPEQDSSFGSGCAAPGQDSSYEAGCPAPEQDSSCGAGHTVLEQDSRCEAEHAVPEQSGIGQKDHTEPEQSRICQVEVTMLDQAGNRVESDSSLLRVAVENGTLLGIENGDLSDVTDYAFPARRAYHGRLIVYVKPAQNGEKTVLRVTDEKEMVYQLALSV